LGVELLKKKRPRCQRGRKVDVNLPNNSLPYRDNPRKALHPGKPGPVLIFHETPEDVTLAAITRDATVCAQVLDDLPALDDAFKPDASEPQSKLRWQVAHVVSTALHKHGKPPGKHLIALVEQEARDVWNVEGWRLQEYVDYAKWLLTINIGTIDFVVDRLKQFNERNTIRKTIGELIERAGRNGHGLSNQEFENIVGPALEKLNRVNGVGGSNSVNRVTAYGEQAWPKPLEGAALQGIAGDFVRLVEPQSEADPAALLIQFLAAFGNIVGRGPNYEVEASKHYTNLFAVVVGITSKGRKGTAWDQTIARFREADLSWAQVRVQSGLASGEGLIWQVRDAISENHPVKEKGRTVRYEEVKVDAGELDKRLLIIEPEFARVLQVCNRVSSILRSGPLRYSDLGHP
jgi:hypothetical protein